MLTRLDPLEEEHVGWKRIDMTMTIAMIENDWYSHRNMRRPFGEGMESTLDIEATRIPQLKTKTKDWLAK